MEVTGRSADDPLAARVRERTGGNPFLVVEVGGLDEVGPRALPYGAKELVSRRLRRLSQASRGALVTAAISGDPVDVSLVADVGDCSEDEAMDLLDGAVRTRLLAVGPDGLIGSSTRWSARSCWPRRRSASGPAAMSELRSH